MGSGRRGKHGGFLPQRDRHRMEQIYNRQDAVVEWQIDCPPFGIYKSVGAYVSA